jgi:hypothetical protein
MIRSQFKVTLFLVAVLMAISMGAKAVGALQPPNPALRGFIEGCEGKPQPCWDGIVPGVTTGDAVKELLKRFEYPFTIDPPFDPGFSSSAYNMPGVLAIGVSFINGIVSQITVAYSNDTKILIGDTMAQVGIPWQVGGETGLRIVSYGLDWQQPYGWWSPFERASVVMIRDYLSSGYPVLWHGFIPKWRYCQIEPEFQDCLN